VLFAFLEKLAPRLHQRHPNATIWVSTQGFDAAQLETFYRLLQQPPAWLSGVVFGPQSRDPFMTQRARIPSSIPMRLYPDIAHTYHSQFPVPEWDPVFALTEGREPINPQPMAQTRIFRTFAPKANGFVTYSEGVNDDVNKFIWTALGVDPTASPAEILTDYAHWFTSHDLGHPLSTRFAKGLAALEHNWAGPIASNFSIQSTLKVFQDIERRAPQAVQRNWRIQLATYRAYFDAYEQLRAIDEGQRERAALKSLALADQLGSLAALDAAEQVLGVTERASLSTGRAHIESLAAALFDSIRLQLSVSRFHASAVGRGANFDTIDTSLNDRVWLEHRFNEIRALPDERQRLAAIRDIVNYEQPVPGSYYDDLGEPGREPHLVGLSADDPDLRHGSHDGIADIHPDEGWRRSWVTYAGALYDEPLILAYKHLNPHTRYRLRVTYAGEDYTLPMRLVANDTFEIHPPRKRLSNPETVEFDLPPEATSSGTLKLTWTRPTGIGGGGRGAQVADVWLLPIATTPH
jgi:hypothetical protein